MQKLTMLLLVIFVLSSHACKKPVTEPGPGPGPGPDFRAKYTGVFLLTEKSTYITHPSSGKGDTTEIVTVANVTISFSADDSMTVLGYPNEPVRPAVRFTSSSALTEKIGMDASGRMYRDGVALVVNSGGFVNADSISHTSQSSGTSFTEFHHLTGHRQ